MATLSRPRNGLYKKDINETRRDELQSFNWAVPLGRIFFAAIFIFSGFNHFTSGSIGYAASQGVPLANILVPVTGLMIIIGGLSVLLGYHTRMGALLILLFLLPTTPIMHNFWSLTDPQEAQNQMAHFMKNLALIGGALLVFRYGAGPISLDEKRSVF